MNKMKNQTNKIILVTSGEPGGIGVDLCVTLANISFNPDYIIVIIGDAECIKARAELLKISITVRCINKLEEIFDNNLKNITNQLLVLNIKCKNIDTVGRLCLDNVPYVLECLDTAIHYCTLQIASAVVTCPISKEIINRTGIYFTGHTEYLANATHTKKVVMMLANKFMKVALVSTHIPLKDVAQYITKDTLTETIRIIINDFKDKYNIPNPKIAVCGLNPHAGEGGYLGDEEINIINPVIEHFALQGYLVSGSYPADTIFNKAHEFDVILAMYHDQGLPVLKYADFYDGINVTLGLPIVRTSVDHGVALDLAGKNLASNKSLIAAITYAIDMST